MTEPALRHMLCPVALHPDGAPLRLPVIVQPDGSQALVHCPETSANNRAQTAADALFIQTGLETRDALLIGHDEGTIERGALWHFCLCRVTPPVRAQWQHLTRARILNRLSWLNLAADSAALSPTDAALCAWIKASL